MTRKKTKAWVNGFFPAFREVTPRIPTNELVNGQRIRCYDNGGETADRYTVAYLDQPETWGTLRGSESGFSMLGMSERPFHPQGFCQHTSGHVGRHLGKRIAFASLPVDCQSAVKNDCPAV